MLLVGTSSGLFDLDGGEALVEGDSVTALAKGCGYLWALLGGHRVVRISSAGPEAIGHLSESDGQSLSALSDDSVIVGLRGARLVRMSRSGVDALSSFEQVPGRGDWENPAGPTPDSRSIATSPGGRLWVNIHVGGVWSSDDVGETWSCAVEPSSDVHQVVAVDDTRAAVAAAAGFGWGGGGKWAWVKDGLHRSYLRATPLDNGYVFVTASTGPFTDKAAVYRAALGSDFVRCEQGLPEWFRSNIDTGCLAASRGRGAVWTRGGALYHSPYGGGGV